MGKGDKKTKRGKIIMGSYGVKRHKKKNPAYVAPVEKKTKEKAKPVEKAEETTVKKTTAKKTTAKKTTAKKEETKTTTAKKTTAKKTTAKKAEETKSDKTKESKEE